MNLAFYLASRCPNLVFLKEGIRTHLTVITTGDQVGGQRVCSPLFSILGVPTRIIEVIAREDTG